jgi:DNA-binding MarR family transcriptional regulator
MSAIRSSKPQPETEDRPPDAETDSIPRIRARDMMLAIQALGHKGSSTLEELRLKLNLDRSETGRTANYSVARDVASELGRQGYAEVGPLPKDARAFEKKKDTTIALTDKGRELAATLRADASAAYVT